MDKHAKHLIEQLTSQFNLTSQEIEGLLSASREEALAEAKIILKEMMLKNILSQTTQHLHGSEHGSETELLAHPQSFFPLESTQAQIRSEINSLQQQISENEQLIDYTSLVHPLLGLDAAVTIVRSDSVSNGTTAVPLIFSKNGKLGASSAKPAPQVEAGSQFGYYVYGILPNTPVDQNVDFGEGQWPENGITAKYPVYPITYRTLRAAVSKVSLDEFGEPVLSSQLKNRQWLGPRLKMHQAILEKLLGFGPLVPMRFCTICKNETEVTSLLAEHYREFLSAIERLNGKQEWAVKIFCDSGTLKAVLPSVSDKVKALENDLAAKPERMAYFLRNRLDRTIDQEVARIGQHYARLCQRSLMQYADATVSLSLPKTGQMPELVLNEAYLIPEEKLSLFQANAATLREKYQKYGLTLEFTGPWPPYNFVSVNLGLGIDITGL